MLPEHSLRDSLPRAPRAQPKGLPLQCPPGAGRCLVASAEAPFQPQPPSICPCTRPGLRLQVPGWLCGLWEPRWGPASLPRAGGTLTDTAFPVLLELEVGAALAAVLGHRELDTLVLAAAIPQGTRVDGWGHTDRSPGQPRRVTRLRGLPSSGTEQGYHVTASSREPPGPSSALCSRSRDCERATLFPRCSRAWLCSSVHTQGARDAGLFLAPHPQPVWGLGADRDCRPTQRHPARSANHWAPLRARVFGAQRPSRLGGSLEEAVGRLWVVETQTLPLSCRSGQGPGGQHSPQAWPAAPAHPGPFFVACGRGSGRPGGMEEQTRHPHRPGAWPQGSEDARTTLSARSSVLEKSRTPPS